MFKILIIILLIIVIVKRENVKDKIQSLLSMTDRSNVSLLFWILVVILSLNILC